MMIAARASLEEYKLEIDELLQDAKHRDNFGAWVKRYTDGDTILKNIEASIFENNEGPRPTSPLKQN